MISSFYQRLVLATVSVSIYNLATFAYSFLKNSQGYSAFSLFSLIPQMLLTWFLFDLWKKHRELSIRLRDFYIVSSLWVLTYFLNLFAWLSYQIDSSDSWSLTQGFLSAFGVPSLPEGAPFAGLMHSITEDSQGDYVWTFDWGVNLSWFLFNLLCVAILIFQFKRVLSQEFDSLESDQSMGSKSMDYLNCNCAIPSMVGDICTNCHKKPFLGNRIPVKPEAEGAVNLEMELRCHKCQILIPEGHNFCSSCGELVVRVETADPEEVEVVCDQCGADLVANQKFCGSCGVEIIWSETISPKFLESSQDQTKKYLAIAAAVIGVLILFGILSSGGSNKQEECFNREMLKFGAYADPKGWAIKSRIYCQSLYP